MRAGLALHNIDLAKPDLVQRDQSVTLIYKAVGIYLTVRGKANENGTQGDVVSATNMQSKRTVTGVVTGRGQIEISSPTPQLVTGDVSSPETMTTRVSEATVSPKTE